MLSKLLRNSNMLLITDYSFKNNKLTLLITLYEKQLITFRVTFATHPDLLKKKGYTTCLASSQNLIPAI